MAEAERIERAPHRPAVDSAPRALDHTPQPEQFVEVEGLRLHYVRRGQEGPAVVMLHGNAGFHLDFSLTIFDQVAQEHQAFAFDRPGHGYSERPDKEVATVEVQARLLRAAFDKLGINKPLLVGHSWGGALALAFAVQYPDEVSGLLLLAPAAYEGDSNFIIWDRLPLIPIIGHLATILFTPLVAPGIIEESLRKAFHPDPLPPGYLTHALKFWTRYTQVRAYAQDEKTLDASLKWLSARYPEIRVPVTIITGDSDFIVKAEHHSHELHRDIPHSKLIALPHTGHQIQHTRPDVVINAIQTMK